MFFCPASSPSIYILISLAFLLPWRLRYTYFMNPADFVKRVVNSYRHYKGVFADHKNAEDMVPSSTKEQKALFLFYVIQLDYAMKSQRLYEGARCLFLENPEFFMPRFILNLSEASLKNYLQDYLKPRYINEAVKRYQLNSQKLLNEYGGNPLAVFEEAVTAKEALKAVRDFRGFGPKIGNFLVRTFINTFDLNYPDIEEILPPVDVHDVRIAFLMGFIESDKMSAKNIKRTKGLWSAACKECGESWLVFDKAFWLLGSEGRPSSQQDILNLLK